MSDSEKSQQDLYNLLGVPRNAGGVETEEGARLSALLAELMARAVTEIEMPEHEDLIVRMQLRSPSAATWPGTKGKARKSVHKTANHIGANPNDRKMQSSSVNYRNMANGSSADDW